MGKIAERGLNAPLYVYIYGFVFLLYKTALSINSIHLLTAIGSLLLYILITHFLFSFFRLFTGSFWAGIPVLIIWGSILHVVSIAQLLGYSFAYIPFSFYVSLYLSVVCLVIGLVYFLRRFSAYRFPLFNQMANVFLLLSCMVFLISGVKKAFDYQQENKIHLHAAIKKHPVIPKDIVWILMDEYASSGSLKQQFGFRNPLDTFLKKAGFVVLPNMHSRFANTLFAVNSIFNNDDSIAPANFYHGIDLLRRGSLIPELEQSGYRFVNLGFFDLSQHPMVANRSGYPYTYPQQLFSGTLFGMIDNALKNTVSACDAYNRHIYQTLSDSLVSVSSVPRFIWAHLTIPHQPFCRNRIGQLQNEKEDGTNDSVLIKKNYIEYLQYGNSLLVQLFKKHPSLLQKIVIISGDHGPRYSFLHDKSYQFWPYAAVYVPIQFDTLGLKRLSYISQIPGVLFRK